MSTITSTNPATGAELKRYSAMDDATVDSTLRQTQQAFLDWRDTDFAHRARLMKAAAQALRDRQQEPD